MSDEAKTPAPVKINAGRSPAYPYCSLATAIERAEKVRDAGAARHAMVPETFYKIWELGPNSSGARQTMAALNIFGLVDYVGRGADRKVQLSELARRIVLDKEPNSTNRLEAIRVAALTPSIHIDMYKQFGPLLPADTVVETYLIRDRDYNESAAKALIREYKDTMVIAQLDKPGDMRDTTSIAEPNKVKPEIGDLVQVEINGALQLEKPSRLRAIQTHDGLDWGFIEGSDTGIRMEQIIVEEKGTGSGKGEVKPPIFAGSVTPPAPGSRKEVFALDEGDVTLTFPDSLSASSFEDLEAYLKVFLRKAKRRAGATDPDSEN